MIKTLLEVQLQIVTTMRSNDETDQLVQNRFKTDLTGLMRTVLEDISVYGKFEKCKQMFLTYQNLLAV